MNRKTNQYLSKSDLLPSNFLLSMRTNCYFMDETLFDREANWYLVDKTSSNRDLISESNLLPDGTWYSILYLKFTNK